MGVVTYVESVVSKYFPKKSDTRQVEWGDEALTLRAALLDKAISRAELQG